MATEGTSVKGFSGTITRLEQRLEDVRARFVELDEAARALEQRLEQHRRSLARQAEQDHVWSALLEHSMSPAEISLLFGYVFQTLQCCHELVLRRLPDLAAGLPTTASVLRRRLKNRRVDAAWRAALEELGLGDGDAKALCVFFVTQGHHCEYKWTGRGPGEQEEVEAVIRRCTGNRLLKQSLLKAVQVVRNGKASYAVASEEHLAVRDIMKHTEKK